MPEDLNNKYRVLLTEVLPYELPLVLNNEAFYNHMQSAELRDLFKCVFSKVKKMYWTIPFDYNLRQAGGEKSRKLSLMHPLTQLNCVDFYEKYEEYMLYLCSRSPFSIRYICKKAKCVFNNEDGKQTDTAQEKTTVKKVELDTPELDKSYRSYFSYRKYDLAYKFFESGDFLRLEQKYSRMMILDITGCFYHIYTHSVAWAVKGKEVAKQNINASTFENDFDKLMQRANYNETNGILVGPEISRIFAEIILQAVDLAIMHQLKSKYILGRDYEIRRYVDDSYIYANSREVLDDIYDAYKEQLAFYKLDINEKKREYFERPFTSCISDAKLQVNKLISELKEKYLKYGDNKQYASSMRSDYCMFSSFVKQFRSVTHRYQQHYGVLNKYTLTLLLNQIRKEMDEEMVPEQNLLTGYADMAFYLFSLDMHTTASYRLCSILDCLVRWSEKTLDIQAKQELVARIRREAKRVIDIYQADFSPDNTNLEVLNLLISLHRLIDFTMPVCQIKTLFGLNKENDKGRALNYFQICTLLYVIEDDSTYDEIAKQMKKEIMLRLSAPQQLSKADNACLFFDVITCPYVSKDIKLTVIQQCLDIKKNKAEEKLAKLTKRECERWFFDWDKTHDLKEFLAKKEYHSPYE